MAIKSHDRVLIRKEEYFRSLTLDPSSIETIDGIRVSLKNAIGLPYGTLFAIDGNEIKPVLEQTLRECEFSTSGREKGSLVSNDNRDIVDSKCNQKLDYDDIKLLRASGAPGKEIMTELVKGNTNFNKKTVFSQEKYLSKKRKRHLGLFTIDRPSTRVLCELYSKLRRDKCLGLRFDTLCHILTYANVHAGSKVLLAETCAGLLLGAVLERLGPAEFGGSVVQFFHGTSPARPEINPAATAAYDKQVFSVCLSDVVPLLTDRLPHNTNEENLANSPLHRASSGTRKVEIDGPKDDDGQHAGDDSPRPRSEMDKPETIALYSDTATRQSLKQIKRKLGFANLIGPGAVPADALIVATRFHPVDLTLLLMQFLPLGKPVVVYCQFLQPLVDLYNAMKQRGGVINLRLSDSWFRRIQVLPDRTHPEITMISSGGYLLCAYTVEPQPSTQQLLKSGLISSTNLDQIE